MIKLALFFVIGATMFQPIVAQGTGLMPEMPWPAQMTVIGIMGVLLFFEGKRRSEDMDRMLEVHRSCSEDISCTIKEMSTDIKGMSRDISGLTSTLQSRPCLVKEQ